MYPHLTEIEKINYFHSLPRGNTLQAYCSLDDARKIISSLRHSNAVSVISNRPPRLDVKRTRYTSTHPNNKAKLHEVLDVLQKTAKDALGTEAQKFIDEAKYAKLPDHVKKILNRAYLEDKPNNDIVLHLEWSGRS